MLKIDLKKLKIEAQKSLKSAKNLKDLDGVFRSYFGKKGEITQAFNLIKDMSKEVRAKFGKDLNNLKRFIEKSIEGKKAIFTKVVPGKEWLDVTAPGKKLSLGHLHPLTVTIRKAIEIFQEMGFTVVEGPEIENEFYNFDALNVPPDHPARDLWDTFWLKDGKMLLRTHTSPVQIHYMEKNNPPLRIIAPGRVFRYEATDASHDVQFYHLEGLMVGKTISVANFIAIIQEFFSRFFGKEVKVRLRPSYFPFVEPGFEVDMSCLTCGGLGCSVCKKTGWLEIMGAGMVHPNVYNACAINSKEWQGFAFGIGLDRLAMMKYKINDIRLFYSGDLRFLEQF
ncbi:phenylalanine--tRNA ligase subunit alpha [Patescibacteria group bacterium]|nr:phenylalanine--tRNA ligase subunit alpha [Patescibacteria group bacterium]MBU4274676.1 phenylalanine--tRNA ligase subunit alpha [Patescibacteria group bacterium]MBU4367722.1 phenylalanine--tRNA ligase subunit alpha [Patescibacteria group bacterium]MBU4461828.1 phenylalanine--tRNA ligase subunit alpha [Patescibacteria group bacterium]MCG2700041.1 phenylalanine--tRNA ligase subunit alpha [Candidatus Parcubacteria bacterium]